MGSCARCGHKSRGLPTATCPECGADLRVVGVRPARRPPGPFAGWLIAWTLAVIVAMSAFGEQAVRRWWDQTGPARRRVDVSRTIVVEPDRGPRGGMTSPGEVVQFSIRAVADQTYWRRDGEPPLRFERFTLHPETATGRVGPDGAWLSGARLEVTGAGPGRTAQLSDSAGRPLGPRRPFDVAAVIAVFAAEGRNVSDPAVADYAAVALGLVAPALAVPAVQPTRVATTPGGRRVGVHVDAWTDRTDTAARPTAGDVNLAVGVALWIAGAVVARWRWRRARRGVPHLGDALADAHAGIDAPAERPSGLGDGGGVAPHSGQRSGLARRS